MDLLKTFFNEKHRGLGAKMVDFGGWEMPVNYPAGVLQEHLATRRNAGLFDVSHMGRFAISGPDALPFLQYVLTNNGAALNVGESQYTIISDSDGHALDDAYLYRFDEDRYILVVNASNREKDWDHFLEQSGNFPDLSLTDRTFESAMLSLQGPKAKEILSDLITSGHLPIPARNSLSSVCLKEIPVNLARTGYTGEPIGFELFIEQTDALEVWDMLLAKGVQPVGLGARDTLRLEACLPLYGHEFGVDAENHPIPIFACPLAKFAVSFSKEKKDFIGRDSLLEQFSAFKKIVAFDYSKKSALPRIILPLAITDKGIARAGDEVYKNNKLIGHVTSGTSVPYWKVTGEGIASGYSEENDRRSICLVLIDSDTSRGEELEIKVRKKFLKSVVVPYHMRTDAPPHSRAVLWNQLSLPEKSDNKEQETIKKLTSLIDKTIANTRWRQQQCINLIPSEQSVSRIGAMLSIADPAGRYAEHKKVKAFFDKEVFYYQGTGFIREVENLLADELSKYLHCRNVETRLISGQMANTAVFSALVDYLNRADRKSEQRRIRKIINNHILNGGHLSAQPMGALRDFVARDPRTDRPAVVNFPVLKNNPYKIDIAALKDIIEIHRPELIIFGKSMTIYPEPVAQVREMVDALEIPCVIMYDMAHVLGLAGPHFQQPFQEGADLVTGSTHKTFFGTQRGIVAGNFEEHDPQYAFWETIERRTFPGSVSNHHLGTMLGLLAAAYEMNHFKDEYQQQVLSNAKAFARALSDAGFSVAGDPEDSFTHTHQVIVHVGYTKGPEIATRLEKNNIIVNYQATPEEEGFTASGALRIGVSEMTRFGMKETDFQELAQLFVDVIRHNNTVKTEVAQFRQKFLEMQFCFKNDELDGLTEQLSQLMG
ncbi:glycine cleavage system aminomethyltransferase GcvT [Desulforhopalus singaporensis]|uniref:Aminomethyltransferase n=1 Tax=Desulforhopalus singaporensis TaxID=91360 RepID=A0A1H0UBC7_9BACT|nr:glycine cleavage system aminomethyltransferase GcvT [Desulforhopalus singaporensis]SDP63612.1 aminomethyltransferase [Desulforhopalus singaporensis]